MAIGATIKDEQSAQQAINACIKSLHHLVDLTEVHYGRIADTIPKIEKNINSTEEEINILIKYFIEMPAKRQRDEGQFLVARALEDIRTSVKTINADLKSYGGFEELLKMFLGDEDSKQTFADFVGLVDEICIIVSDVADLSINAIIYSAKYGEDGRGFGVVSNAIHQNSRKMEEQLKEISQKTGELNRWYDKFNTRVLGAVTEQDEMTNLSDDELAEFFSQLTSSVQSIADLIRNLFANLNEAITPFQELMVLIQRQDLVRQNTENTIKCLKLVQEKLNETDKRSAHDAQAMHIAFANRAIDLVRELSNSMGSVLAQSIGDIITATDGLNRALGDLKEDAQNLTEFMAGANTGNRDVFEVADGSALDFSFDSTLSFLSGFVKRFQVIDQLTSGIAQETEAFNTLISDIGVRLDRLQSPIGFLVKVGVVAKLELARLGVDSMVFGNEIAAVIDDVKQKIEKNRQLFSGISQEMNEDLVGFERIIEETKQRSKESMDSLEGAVESLQVAGGIIGDAINVLNAEIGNITAELGRLGEVVNKTDAINDTIFAANTVLEDLSAYYQEQQSNLGDAIDPDALVDQDQEFSELFAMFTSYLERVTAKDFTGDTDLDVGSSEGELTLF